MTFCLLSVIHKQRLKEYIYYMGFSLSFKVDSYDVNIGGWETKCCRQLLHFTFSLYPIAPKSRRLKRSSSRFFSWLLALNENPDYFNKSEPLTRFWTDYMSSFLLFDADVSLAARMDGSIRRPLWNCVQASLLVALTTFNPLSPNINICLLHTVLHTFLMVLLARICCNVTTFHLWWSFH